VPTALCSSSFAEEIVIPFNTPGAILMSIMPTQIHPTEIL
jgi:hypothetical protein